MNVLDLFSGIGGFSLGLERAGMRTVAFCEIDPYCRRVIAKHWPDVPVWGDIRTLTAEWVMANAAEHRRNEGSENTNGICSQTRSNGIGQLVGARSIDVICGGFPCQDISVAGKGVGIGGERSGLWSEYARIIGEIRPRYVIVENVAALLGRGLSRVLGDLAALGFDAEWHCIPASAVGAPHRRDRVWIVAHAIELSERWSAGWREAIGGRSCHDAEGSGHDALNVADTSGAGLSQRHVNGKSHPPPSRIFQGGELERALATIGGEQWGTEPAIRRVAHGIPARVDRLRSLGNAVIPQIPELIGRAIMSAQ